MGGRDRLCSRRFQNTESTGLQVGQIIHPDQGELLAGANDSGKQNHAARRDRIGEDLSRFDFVIFGSVENNYRRLSIPARLDQPSLDEPRPLIDITRREIIPARRQDVAEV